MVLKQLVWEISADLDQTAPHTQFTTPSKLFASLNRTTAFKAQHWLIFEQLLITIFYFLRLCSMANR